MASVEEIWAQCQYEVIQDIRSGNLAKVKMWFESAIFGAFSFNVNNCFVREKQNFLQNPYDLCSPIDGRPMKISDDFWKDYPVPFAPLELACFCEHIEIVQYLISKGAKVCSFLYLVLSLFGI